MKNDNKAFFIECRSETGITFYFGGPNHTELLQYIKNFSEKVTSFTTWRDIDKKELLKIVDRLKVGKKMKEAEEKIVLIPKNL